MHSENIRIYYTLILSLKLLSYMQNNAVVMELRVVLWPQKSVRECPIIVIIHWG